MPLSLPELFPNIETRRVAWRRGPMFVPHGGSGTSLDLNFMTPGTLPAGLTFTRSSTATYTDANGTMQTAVANTPRWDYNSQTHALRGLLIEEARTNLVFPSVPGGASWAAQASTAALGGSTTVPDGTLSTTALISSSDTANAIRGYANANVTIASASTYTVSVFLKASPNNAYIQINATGGVTSASAAYYDLTNGTAVVGADLLPGATNKSATITPLANGWYRATFTFTTQTGSTSASLFVGPCTTVSSSGDNRSYIGVVGQGIYAWGAQVELGAFPTSYIPTTAASVTRAADAGTMSIVGLYNPPASALAIEEMWISPVSSPDVFQTPAALDDGTFNNLVRFTRSTASNTVASQISAASATIYNPNIGVATVGTVSKTAITYQSGLQASAFNGVMGTGSNNASVPVGITTLRMGAIATNIQALNGYIRRVQYWPRVLSGAELQQVTT